VGPGVVGDAHEGPGTVGEEAPLGHGRTTVLEFLRCVTSVRDLEYAGSQTFEARRSQTAGRSSVSERTRPC
jgi:hypothetical protein